jgi:hypothetical protein
MLEIVSDPPSPPVIVCFPGVESRNPNDLVLILFASRATRADGRLDRIVR